MQAVRRSSHSRWDGRNGAAMAVSRCRDIYSAFRFPRRTCPDDAFDIVSSTARGTAFSLRIKLIGEGARQLSGWRSVSRRIDPALEFGFSRKRHYSRVGATPHSDDSVRPNAKYEILSSPRVATKSRRSTVNRLENGGSPRNGVQPSRIPLSLTGRTHDGLRHAAFDLDCSPIRRDTAPSMVYRGLKNVERFGIERCKRDHPNPLSACALNLSSVGDRAYV
jgi:hypothetical protein